MSKLLSILPLLLLVRTCLTEVTADENAGMTPDKIQITPWREMKETTWCNNDSSSASGFLYVKVHKTASSTTSGVAVRVATNVAHRKKMRKGMCPVKFAHNTARGRGIEERDKMKSFLWSVIRDPSSRALSFYYFRVVNQKGQLPSVQGLQNFLSNGFQGKGGIETYGRGGYQIQYLTTEEHLFPTPEHLSNSSYVNAAVSDVLSTYDFVGVTERLDESFVAMQLLLGLPAGDFLHLNAKTAGGHLLPSCKTLHKHVPLPEMKDYLKSEEWKQRNSGDFALYDAVNKRLDATIESIGRERFQKALAEYHRLQTLIHDRCSDEAIFPCKDGFFHEEAIENCYWADSGCGYPCIDRVLTELSESI